MCFVRGVEKLGFTWSAGTHKYSTGEYRLDQLMNAKKSGRDAAKIHELLCLLGLFFDLDVFQVQSEEPNCLTYEFGKFGG
ncbi:MAG TPA: hypothetical protein VFQ60_04685 [Patescibacteria group bacterium]|nr:hypothetical protein [Patescibacteria group bacterium]